ncbi:SH2 domain containing 3Cb [Morone saxatilis]|uniref:SH2 domain containing 3Cb n=1 Tax=Morone saxatilis TaxID=34816 RepID=UPI0015E248F9|nr:SH2 domain containing 3Cb [Morone saxatilis]
MNKRKLSFKWFGSLTNLSSRRPTEKANIKAVSEHDGILGGAKSAVGGQSVDDMEPCLHSPSYAHSSEMYTHVGTVPRSQKQKKSCKGMKEKEKKKKKEGEEEGDKEAVSGGQIQWKAGEHVRDSPLLSALSSLSLTSLDRPLPVSPLARPLPATPTPSRASPLTSAPESFVSDPSVDPIKSQEAFSRSKDALKADRPITEPSNMATNGPKMASLQDVYVPMDPIGEAAHSHVDEQKDRQRGVISKQETKRTVNGLQEMQSADSGSLPARCGSVSQPLPLSGSSCRTVREKMCEVGDVKRRSVRSGEGERSLQDLTDSSGEYVKFSKDKFWLEPPSEKLKKQLEEELKLSGTNLKSHAWYHGRIPWEVSESLVVNHGDFLIRDSQSSQGDVVLTSHWEQKTLHFLIRKTVVQSGETYTRVQYSLEGEAFESLPALVHFYVGSRAALTQWSGAQILRPVNRTLPLSYLETAFCTAISPPSCYSGLMNCSERGEERVCPRSPSSLHQKEADVNREQDGRHLLTAGESSLSTPYNNSEFNTIFNSFCSLLQWGQGADPDKMTFPQRLKCNVSDPPFLSPPSCRFQTMATMLAVDVLGCTGTTEERAGLLHKIIQIAAELKSTMGNMFGFAAVMRALELPQVSRLEQTWMALRQRHTEGAILYEKTLRPFMKSLNDGRESCPLSNTTFPHVLPLLSLLEKSMAVGEGTEPWETVEVGVDVVMFHLGAARTIAQLGGIYRSNAESKLKGFQEQSEVLELFLTDFQMRLLWGSRGAEESQVLRYAKFDQVLTALSNKLEPPVRPH